MRPLVVLGRIHNSTLRRRTKAETCRDDSSVGGYECNIDVDSVPESKFVRPHGGGAGRELRGLSTSLTSKRAPMTSILQL